jgi:uncharacterized membrane protein
MKMFLLVFTATLTGLMAGLFFAWSCSVTLGLAHVPDTAYLTAMQAMNRAIQNPAFFICFLGAAIFLPICTYQQYHHQAHTRFWLLLAATALYLIGIIGVTFIGNVPLNQTLDKFNIHVASSQQMAAQRAQFESLWNRLNNIRTVMSTLSFILVVVACIWKDH